MINSIQNFGIKLYSLRLSKLYKKPQLRLQYSALNAFKTEGKITPACTMALMVSSLVSYPLSVQAQPTQPISTVNAANRLILIARSQTPNGTGDGRPPSTTDGGSRGDCLYKTQPLVPLLPADQFGLTVNERPTFWFYVPYTPAEATTGEFSVQDEQDNDLYRTSFKLPATPGIVSISLPATKSLEINQRYIWHFKLSCPTSDSLEKSTPAFVRGWVQRISLTAELASQLKAAKTPQERLDFYIKHNIWYDRLTELATLRRQEPQNISLKGDWTNLFKSVGLELLANEPIMGNVTTKSLPE